MRATGLEVTQEISWAELPKQLSGSQCKKICDLRTKTGPMICVSNLVNPAPGDLQRANSTLVCDLRSYFYYQFFILVFFFTIFISYDINDKSLIT